MSKAKPQWELPDNIWESMVGPALSSPEVVERAVAEVDGILLLTDVAPATPILDLGCGKGRHALALAHRGFSVTGVDSTVQFLDQARQQAHDEGLVIEFIQEDMREFMRPDFFSLALNLNTSFGYFEDPGEDLQVLRNVFASLQPGGSLVLETIGKEVLARIFQERDWFEKEGYLFLQERRPTEDWSRMNVRWIKIVSGKKEEWSFTHRLFAATELTALMRNVGFTTVNTYGDYQGNPYDHTALRLVVVAIKG